MYIELPLPYNVHPLNHKSIDDGLAAIFVDLLNIH